MKYYAEPKPNHRLAKSILIMVVLTASLGAGVYAGYKTVIKVTKPLEVKRGL